jgi:hypothetical protein
MDQPDWDDPRHSSMASHVASAALDDRAVDPARNSVLDTVAVAPAVSGVEPAVRAVLGLAGLSTP